jgi:hypothetical protein
VFFKEGNFSNKYFSAIQVILKQNKTKEEKNHILHDNYDIDYSPGCKVVFTISSISY